MLCSNPLVHSISVFHKLCFSVDTNATSLEAANLYSIFCYFFWIYFSFTFIKIAVLIFLLRANM